jgi:hypothetical protein
MLLKIHRTLLSLLLLIRRIRLLKVHGPLLRLLLKVHGKLLRLLLKIHRIRLLKTPSRTLSRLLLRRRCCWKTTSTRNRRHRTLLRLLLPKIPRTLLRLLLKTPRTLLRPLLLIHSRHRRRITSRHHGSSRRRIQIFGGRLKMRIAEILLLRIIWSIIWVLLICSRLLSSHLRMHCYEKVFKKDGTQWTAVIVRHAKAQATAVKSQQVLAERDLVKALRARRA